MMHFALTQENVVVHFIHKSQMTGKKKVLFSLKRLFEAYVLVGMTGS